MLSSFELPDLCIHGVSSCACQYQKTHSSSLSWAHASAVPSDPHCSSSSSSSYPTRHRFHTTRLLLSPRLVPFVLLREMWERAVVCSNKMQLLSSVRHDYEMTCLMIDAFLFQTFFREASQRNVWWHMLHQFHVVAPGDHELSKSSECFLNWPCSQGYTKPQR